MSADKDILIIFDLDGTLFQTGSTVIPAVQKSLDEIGLPHAEPELIKSLLGEKTSVFCERLMDGDQDKLQEFNEKFWKYEKKYVEENGELYDGVVEMLDTLRVEGYEMTVLSNGSQEYVDYVLQVTGIEEYFVDALSSSQFDTKSDGLQELLDEVEHESAVMVGDTAHDIDAAEECGIPSIGVPYGYGKIEGATYVAAEVSDVVSRVRWIDIFHLIEREIEDISVNRSLVLGVNGIDNSGKSEFAENLSRYLKARGEDTSLVSIDDFHNPREMRRKGENEVDSYIENAFDMERLEDEILAPISKGMSIDKKLDVLNLETDEYDKQRQIKIKRGTIVILEGVLLYRLPIDDYLDYRIYLDVDYRTMIERVKKRDKDRFKEDVVERYERKYIPIQEKYLEEHRAKQKSDLIIDNNNYKKPIIIK